MVKIMKHYQMNRSTSFKDQHVSIKSFPGATMKSASIVFSQRWKKVNQITFYYMWEPTISLQSKMPMQKIKYRYCFEIVSREDDLNVKGKAVNKYHKEKCRSSNV